MKEMLRYDKGEVKGKAERTDEGYIKADAVLTRTGVFLYANADGSIRRELRHPDDVFQKTSLDTIKMIPMTHRHPKQKLVNADNAKELKVGHVGENVTVDGKFILAPLSVTDKTAVDAVEGGECELSLGYTVDLEEVSGEYNGEAYTHRQRNIKYNHLAIVDRARAGGAARIHLDGEDAEQTLNDPTQKNERTAKMKKVTLDGIEYDAAPEVANALKKEGARADKAESELEKVKADAKTATDEAEKQKAKFDAMAEELKALKEKGTNTDELQKAIKARVALEGVANKVLKADDAKKLDTMSDMDVMKAVILVKAPDCKLDGQSDVYVQARFDAIVETLATASTTGEQRRAMNEDGKGKSEDINLDEAAKSAFEEMKNQYKTPDKK